MTARWRCASAQEEWVAEGNQRPLDDLTDEAMNAVAPLTGPDPTQQRN